MGSAASGASPALKIKNVFKMKLYLTPTKIAGAGAACERPRTAQPSAEDYQQLADDICARLEMLFDSEDEGKNTIRVLFK